MNTLRELLNDIADRGKPVELAASSLAKARRLRLRRRLTAGFSGVAVVVLLMLGSYAIVTNRPTAGGGPVVSPMISELPSATASDLPQVLPGKDLPGGWIWGGGTGTTSAVVYDRGAGGLREVPYDWAIPAPVGDLVYVARQDSWTGVLDLRTGAVKQLQAAGKGEWSVGVPQWSGDGKRLLRADGDGRIFITDAVTGGNERIDIQGCDSCNSPVWLPGEKLIALSNWRNNGQGVWIHSLDDGALVRNVPWHMVGTRGFSPDGRYVVAKVDDRAAIFDLVNGGTIARLDGGVSDTRTAYWAGADVILVIESGGASQYSLQGKKIGWYPWPESFEDDELPNFTLIRGS
ncbi:MAG TPA: hypothetical protein VF062_05725 [Candidatus Limnocylindrales bacterium]